MYEVPTDWYFTVCVTVAMGCFPQGIVFLVENELLRHTPEDIAQFLYKGEGLNKTAIGDYLGERCTLPTYLQNHFSSSLLTKSNSCIYFWPTGTISTSKFFRLSLTSMSSQI